MKLVILGASGGCGLELVKQAAQRGHNVVAVVRETSDFPPVDNVKLLRGELSDEDFLSRAFEGSDAVLSAVGMRLPSLSPFAKSPTPNLLAKTTPIIINAMKRAQVRRIMAISAGGVGDSRAWMPAVFRFFINSTALRIAYADLEVMEQLLRASGLEVCCPRPTGLTDQPATGKVVVAKKLAGRATIPRSDVAAWMLNAVEAGPFVDFGPVLTVTGAV